MTIIQKIMKAGELPPEWAKEFPDPDMKVKLRVAAYDEELETATSPLEVLEIVSRRAEERGLTREIFDEIMNDK